MIIFFWMANRQFHFKKRKKDGSRLSSIATHEDALDLNKDTDDETVEEDEDDEFSQEMRRTSWKSLLDYETEPDDDDEQHQPTN